MRFLYIDNKKNLHSANSLQKIHVSNNDCIISTSQKINLGLNNFKLKLVHETKFYSSKREGQIQSEKQNFTSKNF